MPSYDYQCKTCNHEFTASHKIADPAPACPQCGAEVRKKLSAPAIGNSSRGREPSFSGHSCGSGGCGHKH